MFGFENNPTLQILKTGLDGLERRHTLLSNNIANMNTPGFVAQDVDFKSVMDAQARNIERGEGLQLSETSENHMMDDQMRSDKWDEAVTNSLDAPDMQSQMVGLNQNSMQYSAVAQLVNQQLSRYRKAIQDGSR